MHERMQPRRKGSVFASGGLAALLLICGAPRAFGQTATPGEAAPPAPPDQGEPPTETGSQRPPAVQPPAEPTPPPPPLPPPPPTPPGQQAEFPFGTVPKGPVPAASPPAMPNIDYGGRLRSALRFQGTSDPKSFNDVAATLYADLYASGQINRMWRWLLALTSGEYGGSSGQTSTVSASILDAMAGFTPIPEFQVYAGRMLVMADRYAPSGPWSLDEWFYPGFFGGNLPPAAQPAPPAVPKGGPAGRDVGVTAWGAPLGGHLKYYLGAYQMQDPTLSPLYSGRVQVSLLSPEPGWFHRTTYYGDRDLVSIGVGGQFQKHGSVMTVPAGTTPPPPPMLDDYHEINADLIVEKRIGDLGALSLEGAYYNYSGAYQPWKWSMVAAIAYNSPVLAGIGKLRPSFRFQQAQAKQVTDTGANLDPTRVYDVQVTYAVMHWFTHVVVNYRHYDVVYASSSAAAPAASPPHNSGNMIVVGVQLWDP
jgi:hypothetical protein